VFAAVSWMPFVAMALLIWVLVYIHVRLGFWTVAILSDRLGVIAALRRSWELTRGNWWRMLALGLIPVIAAMPLAALPHQVGIVIGLLLTPVADAITTSAYLQRIGVLPAPPRLPSPLARHGAVTLPGF
jgi:membrane-anchored glycerophosphoryl diester phosphodiesterase (GDPDase)